MCSRERPLGELRSYMQGKEVYEERKTDVCRIWKRSLLIEPLQM